MKSPLLVARDLHKTFDRGKSKGVNVLRGANLDIYPGDRIAILGKSGAGKSTLLHILGALETPNAGSVKYMGHDLFQLNETRLSKFRNQELGFVFQFHYLMLEFTAGENVMMPALIGKSPKREARKRAEELLSWVGLQNRGSHKPGQLSGGEQQRVAIARALMMNPKLLLTDEMTGNLDPVTGKQVFELVYRLHEKFGVAIVSVTHDEALASLYPRILRLVEGRLED